MAGSENILITGATGHIGFRVLVHALEAGKTVCCAVRSHTKANSILSHPLIQNLNPGRRLTFTIVPDLTAPSAYDNAVQGGITHIIHIASPLRISAAGDEIPLNEQDAYFIQPAVRGTLNVLEAAKKAGTIKRVVITSSLTAIVPIEQLTGQEPRPWWQGPIRPDDRVPFELGPYETEFEAYAASKVAALHEAEAWMSAQTAAGAINFDVVYLHPSFVEGRNELALSPRDALKGTNALILGLALGKQFENSIANASVHIDDVVRAHVRALDANVPGGMGYILSQKTDWSQTASIAGRAFPDAVRARTLLPCGVGKAEVHDLPIDASLTEDVFGFVHKGFEEQVQSVVGHYLELRTKSRAQRTRTASSLRPPVESQKMKRVVSGEGLNLLAFA